MIAIDTVSTYSTMNLIHKLSITALILLSLITTGMLIQHHISTQNQQGAAGKQGVDLQKYYEERIAKDTEIYSDFVILLKEKQYSAAKEKLKEIKAAHPKNPLSSVYLAQLQYEQGQIASAIHSYRLAVDSEPDYVDKKTPLFIGDKIMNLITEARSKLSRENKLRPGDKAISLALEDVYYLQRRIAGGCE